MGLGEKFIGEVVVKVKLTNAGDDTLVRRGLMKKKTLALTKPQR